MNILIPQTAILHHFTSDHLIGRIRREGLQLGALPWHRCPKTGEACLIKNWVQRFMTGEQLHRSRSWERWMYAQELKGSALAREKRENLFPGFQWLTSNPDFVQTWCLLGSLPFPRNAWRITVLVPEKASVKLLRWQEMCERFSPACAEEINLPSVDWRNWSVFNGWIPPEWFLEVHRNPGETLAADPIVSP